MAKYHGKIGFVKIKETEPGVWVEHFLEKDYKGDINRNYRRWDNPSDKINSDLNVNMTITIIADKYAIDNAPYIRYAEAMGGYWSINSIEVNRPRLILELGGVYHKQEDSKLSEEEETPSGSDAENNFGER